MLGLLDQEPLRLLSKINLEPRQFAGDASAQIEIMRPNKRDVPANEYRYSGDATFDNMEISGLFGDSSLDAGKGSVRLEPRSMTVTADALLAQAPISLKWRQNFFDEDGPSEFSVSGSIDSSTADLIGVATRQYVRGPIAFNAEAKGELGNFEYVDLQADFQDATLSVDALGWRKPAGAPGKGRVSLAMSPSGMDVKALSLEGQGVSIAGEFTLDASGALQRAHLPRIYLEQSADLSMTARRDETNALVVNAVGEYLNAAPIIEAVVDGPARADSAGDEPGWGPGLSLNARIDRVGMRQGVEYRFAALDVWRDQERLQGLSFTAFDHDGPPLSVEMTLAEGGGGAGPVRTIRAQSASIGAFLRAVFGITSVEGGEGEMQVRLRGPGEDGIAGQIEARNLIVVDAPLLARIFSAGSLEGLSSLLNDQGIDLSYAFGKFDYRDGVLSLDDMRATGPSVGITADGVAAMGAGGDIRLSGAVAPVYQINSLLGNAPLIGDILVGKKGEGVLALSYTVTGERNAPVVAVNPLSALTPGIFRRLFQPQLDNQDPRRDAPDPASVEERPGE
ncbi:MAG: hypothetical protein ACX939_01870 [Hyphococcus sp.]